MRFVVDLFWSSDKEDSYARREEAIASMKMFSKLSLCWVVLFLNAASIWGQSGAIEPPPILKITKMMVKIGKLPEVQKLESERIGAMKKFNYPRSYISSVSLTGPQQVWIFSRYKNLQDMADDIAFVNRTPALRAEMEKLDDMEGSLLNSKRDITASYQPNISYRPNFDWADAHYWEIIWVHLINGHHDEYIENRIMTKEEHEKGAFDTHQMMYAVQSGEPSGTFMVIRPMKTMGLLDALNAAGHSAEPTTAEEQQKKKQLSVASVVSVEDAYFRVESNMTYVPQ